MTTVFTNVSCISVPLWARRGVYTSIVFCRLILATFVFIDLILSPSRAGRPHAVELLPLFLTDETHLPWSNNHP